MTYEERVQHAITLRPYGVVAATAADFKMAQFRLYKEGRAEQDEMVWVYYPIDVEKVPEGGMLWACPDWERIKSEDAQERLIEAANQRGLMWAIA